MGISGAEQHTLQTHFGVFLKMRRDQWGVRQREVLLYLPGWTQTNYSRLESNAIAPAFDQLLPIYASLQQAGVQWDATDRQQYLVLARKRIEEKKRHTEQHSEREWADLRYQLANVDFLLDEPDEISDRWSPPKPLQAETRHLLGREEWLATITQAIQTATPKKLVVLHGPVGIGKSSELHRLIQHFIHATELAYHVIWIPLLPAERGAGPESSLTLMLGNILAESGAPPPTPEMASWEKRQRLLFAHLEQSPRPIVILVDNAENALVEDGSLSACWEEFLTHFLRRQHRATLVMATKEWPGWPGRDRVLVQESAVPPLDAPTGVQLLQQLGLESVPLPYLREVYARVGGIPLCLEWVAALAQDPLLLDDWLGFDVTEHPTKDISAQLAHLLAEPILLREHMASRLQPLFERVIAHRLSAEARALLNHLALCNVPLGKTALQALCDRPAIIRELRNNSLLVAYSHRVQVLPMVASVVEQGLTTEQICELEEHIIIALQCWVEEGSMDIQEAGHVITELAMLLLKHHRLLEAAELLIRYGWLSFNQGHAPQLAHLAEKVMNEFDWQASAPTRCGGLLLYYILSPFLGKMINAERRVVEYQSILDDARQGIVCLFPSVEGYITSYIMLSLISKLRFEEAKVVLEASSVRLGSLYPSNKDLHEYLLQLRAWLLGKWGDYAEEQGEKQTSQKLLKQTIAFYRQCTTLLLNSEEQSLLKQNRSKMRLARYFNDLGYHLARDGRFEEALQNVERGIKLKEQGYVDFGTLASSYGEKAEILMELGQFREAMLYDEKTLTEIERCANAGHTASQEEVWVYFANRGRLYLRLGKIDEAERLLRESLPHIQPRRVIYQMFAKDALDEIGQWRKTKKTHYQLDWRWVERYRVLASFDSYWWLAPAGPFNKEEQQQWNELIAPDMDEATKQKLSMLILQSRERELTTAITEQQEPRLHYPAIDIEAVRTRIIGLYDLDTEICQAEPNAIVRRLYHEAIEEDICFLRLVEATYEGNSERFWECNLVLNLLPTQEEMNYALERIKVMLKRGLAQPEAKEVTLQFIRFLRERMQISLDLSHIGKEIPKESEKVEMFLPTPQLFLSAQTAKRFFEDVLQQSDFNGWQVIIDPNASSARVEHGLRHLYLTNSPLPLDQIRHYLSHELAGHVGRCVAGEHSMLGLLGIHTKNSLETEEGLAIYYDRQIATQLGQIYNDTAIWTATLATGLASGVMTSPQSFLSLCAFFEILYLLYQLVQYPGIDSQQAKETARKYALAICLRTYRGVPDLDRRGICFTKDANYLRGLRKIEQAVEQNINILDQLAVGVVSLDLLPDLQELGIASYPQPLRKIITDPDLDTYILSFKQDDENSIR